MESLDVHSSTKHHFDTRRKMIIHHRAAHERLRNSILASAREIMNSMTPNDGTRFSDIKITLAKTLQDYEVIMVSCEHILFGMLARLKN
jgi:hypothetical protein